MHRPEPLLAHARRWAGGLALAAALGFAALAPASAREAAPATADPALEAHVMRLSSELRCLVCQNETIAASHAELAVDLRNQVREMLQQGRSDAEVMAYMTDRYGDFVLYRPPLKSTTWLLWFGPALLLLGGLLTLVIILRRRSRMADDRFEPDHEDDATATAATPQPPGTFPPAPHR
jgi:cytochrome c-type biogenesis protein CcmH